MGFNGHPARVRDINQVSGAIIGACIEIHKAVGPGLLESAYRECLCYELSVAGLGFEREKALPIEYKGVKLDCGYRLDLVVENTIVVELKNVERLAPIHSAQLLTYLRLTKLSLGLLINFNVPVLAQGVRRIAN
jgi:GxxExxY protein